MQVSISNPLKGFNYIVAYYLEQDPTPAPGSDEYNGLALLYNPTTKLTTLASIQIQWFSNYAYLTLTPVYFGGCAELEDGEYCWAGSRLPELNVLPEPLGLGEFARKTLGTKEV